MQRLEILHTFILNNSKTNHNFVFTLYNSFQILFDCPLLKTDSIASDLKFKIRCTIWTVFISLGDSSFITEENQFCNCIHYKYISTKSNAKY